MFGFLILLIIAAICGSIGASIAGASKKGCLTNIALGFIGAIIGNWLRQKLHMNPFFVIEGIAVVWSIIGSAIFVALISLISGADSNKK